jgi:hypothetical protein
MGGRRSQRMELENIRIEAAGKFLRMRERG